MRDFLKERFRSELPGEESHLPLMPINRPLSSDAFKNAENYRESAVGIYIFPHQSAFHTVLIQRPKYDGTHSGQISFPGGKKEHSDPTIEFTARRETFEEVGIDFHTGELIGGLTDVYIPVSKFIVRPFVYFLDETPNFKLDPREVEDILLVDLESSIVNNPIERSTIEFRGGIKQKNVPHFTIQENIVWGATGMILAELRDTIQPFYK